MSIGIYLQLLLYKKCYRQLKDSETLDYVEVFWNNFILRSIPLLVGL